VIGEHVSFPGSQGVPLAGRLDRPEGETVAWALFAHCFTCSKDLRSAGLICRELTARGIAVLRFDFTGLGESGGDFAASNFTSNVEDIVAAAEFLRRRGQAPALLVGHSLGGAAVLAAAPHLPEAAAVATIGAPGETAHLGRTLAARLEAAEAGAARARPSAAEATATTAPEAPGPGPTAAGPKTPDFAAADPAAAPERGDDGVEIDLGGTRPVRIGRKLLDDLAVDHLHGALAHLGRPLLIFHSPVDRVVGIDHAERLFLAARHPKSFVSLGAADHLLSDPRDAAQAGAVLAAWAGRYLPAAPAREPVAGETAKGAARAPGEVEVVGAGALRQEIHAGGHHLAADEPVADGGSDAGPSPYGLLLAALGACTAMTLRLYADSKGIPLAGTRVRLRHGRSHAADCEQCERSAAALERIDLDLELLGALTEQQRERLLEIAGRCPVHRTLTSKVDVFTRLL
jgi:uncharacterized OsmC-like protein/pimeloyl-ACP methyl ester carboxylesterase